MIDDSTIGDAARIPGDETQVSARAGVRASTKKTTKKAAKKTAKKTTKKKTAGADERSRDGRARKKTAKKAAKKAAKPAAATSAVSEAVAPDAAAADPALPYPPVPDAPPLDDAATGAATASDGTAPDAAAERSPPAAKRAPPADAARRLGPMPPGAYMPGDAESEDPGGLGGILALWGPLIIVGFLVLVFLGEDEREVAAASGHDIPAPASVPATAAGAEAPQVSDPAPDPAGAVLARAFGEAGASPLPAASRVAAPWTDSGGAWPAPPGPYRNPGSHDLPSGEHWAARASEWAPSADGRGVQGYGAGGNPPPQWVRCEAPYYWCPAPGNPTW